LKDVVIDSMMKSHGTEGETRRKQTESLESEVKSLTSLLESETAKLTAKTTECDRHLASAGQLSANARTAEIQLEKERKQKEKRDEKIKEVEEQLGSCLEEKAAMKDLIDKAETRAKRAEEDRERHKVALNELTTKQKELWTELENTRREKRDKSVAGRKNPSDIEDKVKLQEGISKLEVDKKSLASDQLVLQQDQQKLVSQSKELKEWKDNLMDEKEDMRAEWERLKAERQELLTERLQFEQQRRK